MEYRGARIDTFVNRSLFFNVSISTPETAWKLQDNFNTAHEAVEAAMKSVDSFITINSSLTACR